MKQTNVVLTEAVFYTLLALHKPLHGYGIMQETEQMSNGRLKLSAGTLYGALSSLLEKGWIAELPIEKGSRKKEYEVTKLGKEIASLELQRLEELVNNGKSIINKISSNEKNNF
ncbi:MAG: helix-turn-helix transcriptional regulator [Bacteroidaceae bacterium]